MPANRQQLIARAKKKIGSLLRKGTPFNPRTVSGSTLQAAANSGSPMASGMAKKEIRRRIKAGTFR
jgi:hypothetical protein